MKGPNRSARGDSVLVVELFMVRYTQEFRRRFHDAHKFPTLSWVGNF